MEKDRVKKRVSAVVPAFNEEKTIIQTVNFLKKCNLIDEIVVIDDASKDKTYERLRQIKNITLIKNKKNLGKGGSMEKGVKVSNGDIVLFCDADYTYLPKSTLKEVIEPVLKDNYDMFIGIQLNDFNKKVSSKKRIPRSFFISGLRSIKREKWEKFPKIYKKRFRIEIGLSFYMIRYKSKWGFKLVEFNFLKKEEKYGPIKGLIYRFLMILDIITAYFLSRIFGNLSFYFKKFFGLLEK